MIKNYKLFEQVDDPYGEETEESDMNIDGFRYVNGNAETRYTLEYEFLGQEVIFEMWYDDMGYSFYETYQECYDSLSKNIKEFIKENHDEIRAMLQEDIRHGRF